MPDISKVDFAAVLQRTAKLFQHSPDFKDTSTLRAWGLALYPHADLLVPVLMKAPALWSKFPSIRELLDEIGISPKNSRQVIRQAVTSVWSYLESVGEPTPLGERVFLSLGGWEHIASLNFDQQARSIYNSQLYDRAEKLLFEDENNALPKPDQKLLGPTKTEENALNFLESKMRETHNAIHKNTLYVDEDLEERKRAARESGADYYEPPRSWEINRQLNPEERKMWLKKIEKEMKRKRII